MPAGAFSLVSGSVYMAILRVLLIALEVVLLFNFIILVHELGHFLMARARGLYVDRFAIWFGKPLWSKKIGDVTYQLGSIPAGGFVSLPQLSPMEWIEGKTLPSGAPLLNAAQTRRPLSDPSSAISNAVNRAP